MVLSNIAPLRRFRGQKSRIALAALAASTAIGQWAPAATDTWTLDGSGNWATASNWSSGVPVANDDVDITDDDAISRIVTYNYTGAAATLSGLTVDNYGAANNTLQMTGNYVLNADDEYFGDSGSDAEPGYGFMIQSQGTNATSGELTLGLGTDDLGAYTLSGGVCTSGFFELVGDLGTGSFVQTGGSNSITDGNLYIASASGSNGTYSLSGTATLNVSNTIDVGVSGTAAFNISGGTVSATNVNVSPSGAWNQSGGTANLTGTFAQSGPSASQSGGSLTALVLTVGGVSGATASYTLSGSGSIAFNNTTYGNGRGNEYVGEGGNGLFVQSGGTNTPEYNLIVGASGNGTYSLTGGSLSSPPGGNVENLGYTSGNIYSNRRGQQHRLHLCRRPYGGIWVVFFKRIGDCGLGPGPSQYQRNVHPIWWNQHHRR
jgi:T5SS/PEP-CTERM-associated repeat protein